MSNYLKSVFVAVAFAVIAMILFTTVVVLGRKERERALHEKTQKDMFPEYISIPPRIIVESFITVTQSPLDNAFSTEYSSFTPSIPYGSQIRNLITEVQKISPDNSVKGQKGLAKLKKSSGYFVGEAKSKLDPVPETLLDVVLVVIAVGVILAVLTALICWLAIRYSPEEGDGVAIRPHLRRPQRRLSADYSIVYQHGENNVNIQGI